MACLYILVSCGGFVRHFDLTHSWDPSRFDGLWIESRRSWLFCEIYMPCGRDWGSMAWMSHAVEGAARDGSIDRARVFFALIGWGLFDPKPRGTFVGHS